MLEGRIEKWDGIVYGIVLPHVFVVGGAGLDSTSGRSQYGSSHLAGRWNGAPSICLSWRWQFSVLEGNQVVNMGFVSVQGPPETRAHRSTGRILQYPAGPKI